MDTQQQCYGFYCVQKTLLKLSQLIITLNKSQGQQHDKAYIKRMRIDFQLTLRHAPHVKEKIPSDKQSSLIAIHIPQLYSLFRTAPPNLLTGLVQSKMCQKNSYRLYQCFIIKQQLIPFKTLLQIQVYISFSMVIFIF